MSRPSMTSNGVSSSIRALVLMVSSSPFSLINLITHSISLESVQCPSRPLQALNILTQFLHVYKLTNILFTVLQDTRSLGRAPESNNTLAVTCCDSCPELSCNLYIVAGIV